MPAAVLGAAVLEEGRQRAGGNAGEAVGEAVVGDVGEVKAKPLVREAGEAVVGGVGTPFPGGGVAHRGRLC